MDGNPDLEPGALGLAPNTAFLQNVLSSQGASPEFTPFLAMIGARRRPGTPLPTGSDREQVEAIRWLIGQVLDVERKKREKRDCAPAPSPKEGPA
jgi:hypothetical protein